MVLNLIGSHWVLLALVGSELLLLYMLGLLSWFLWFSYWNLDNLNSVTVAPFISNFKISSCITCCIPWNQQQHEALLGPVLLQICKGFDAKPVLPVRAAYHVQEEYDMIRDGKNAWNQVMSCLMNLQKSIITNLWHHLANPYTWNYSINEYMYPIKKHTGQTGPCI